MALKVQILGADVTFTTSSGYTATEQIPQNSLVEILQTEDFRAGDGSYRWGQLSCNMECPLNQQGSGFQGIEVFDKDNNSVLEMSKKGKIGATNGFEILPKNIFNLILNLRFGPTESSTSTPSVSAPGSRIDGEVVMSPTNFSTGKIKLMYSGKLPTAGTVGMVAGVDAAVGLLGRINSAPGASGHSEIEINFAVLTV